ncbi:methyl-accepting chemotaxis protein [Undibacterium cyanobacteriorum]|uniref:Methyl-accepting chemotaxis protein n=1 Tax=Undibacterium cyanobacteriorum TaxID=3073561 RepID=A0ABY9RI92_9BURK|nr:methyl-accepting chemotaxis protein [Undibacterium sp. 20NA77.5]WMW80005.1 methyl-accepting chemotaxis protein [Undibacterium sp. 20NA77.5]
MQAFYDLKIATKLIVGFVGVLLLTAFLGLFSISQLATVNRAADEIGNDWMPSAIEAMGMKESISRMRSQEAQLATADNPDDAKKYQDRTNEAIEQFKKHHTASLKYADQPGEKQVLDDALAAFNEYVQISNKIGNLAREGNSAGAVALLRTDSSKANKKIRDLVDKVVDDHIAGGKQAFAESSATYKRAQTWVIGVIIVAILVGLTLALWLAKIVSAPLQEAVELAESIAHGDLTKTVVPSSTCEIGQLTQALAEMNASLLKVVGEVRTGTDQINDAAAAIANGNLDLSQRTEEQASSLEETASSMEEITSTIKHNSDNARQANILSQSATAVAEKGGSVVSEVVTTMNSINESSRKIVDIISVIDGIAFQTNILALNAAVEAARAGEQGRGFAVVASEVRSLAQRSASAAKEIKELINDSVEKVSQGSRLVDTAGSTMQEVVESVKRVSDMISEITAAGQEQSSGVDQINNAIMQMDSVTQQNAALVEEAAAAAATLQEQAENLVKVVSVFKLDQSHFATNRPRATARPAPSPAPSRRSAPPAAAPRIKATPAKASAQETQDWEEF